jgi:hypothetical protein
MIITTLNGIGSLPQPALGFLSAIHDAEVENTAFGSGAVIKAGFFTINGVKVVLPFDSDLATVLGLINSTIVAGASGLTGSPVLASYDFNLDKVILTSDAPIVLGDAADTSAFLTAFKLTGGPSPVTSASALGLGPIFPEVGIGKGRVFVNNSTRTMPLLSWGRWPSRQISSGELYGCDGRGYYKVSNKIGTSSYYPDAFERTLFNFSFNNDSFGIGQEFIFEKAYYFRLIGNNTPAVWSVIVEVGMRVDDVFPVYSASVDSVLFAGSTIVSVPVGDISKIKPRSKVYGDGIPVKGINEETPVVLALDLATGSVVLSRPATLNGNKNLRYEAAPGPNLGDYVWLPPMMEQQIVLTDMKCRHPLGFQIKNWGEKGNDMARNDLGYSGFMKKYTQAIACPTYTLPTGPDFVIRVRLGQFDVTNSTLDPRGYAAYVITDPGDRTEMAG